MEYEEILYEVDDGIATVTLNRPDRLNAITATMSRELQDAMIAAGADPRVRAIILTGAGRGFCAGADMKLLQSIQGDGSREAEQQTRDFQPREPDPTARDDFRRQYSYFPSISKPILAAINGPVAGLGFVLALYCDLRLASTTARMGTIFARRGLIAEHGVSWLLPRLIGMANAADLLFSGRMIDPEEALAMGLVSRVIEPDRLLAEVRERALEIATTASPRSVAVMKRQIYEAQFQDLAGALDHADREMIKSFDSEDFKEGVAHFVEKRAPKFTGK